MKPAQRAACSMLLYSILSLGMVLPVQGAVPRARKSGWENLGMIAPGDTVKVVLNDGKIIQGSFKGSSAGSISIQANTSEKLLQRENVLRVSVRGARHRGRNMLIGAVIGAGAGLGMGALSDRSPKCGPSGPFFCGQLLPNRGKEILTPVGALIGGVTGLLLPTGRWQEIYRTR